MCDKDVSIRLEKIADIKAQINILENIIKRSPYNSSKEVELNLISCKNYLKRAENELNERIEI